MLSRLGIGIILCTLLSCATKENIELFGRYACNKELTAAHLIEITKDPNVAEDLLSSVASDMCYSNILDISEDSFVIEFTDGTGGEMSYRIVQHKEAMYHIELKLGSDLIDMNFVLTHDGFYQTVENIRIYYNRVR